MKTTCSVRAMNNKGFTLVEIMIAVAIIALLASIALPSLRKARLSTQNAKFENDLRIARDAFEMLVTFSGTYPGDETPGVLPAEVQSYLPRFKWTAPTSIGGQWDWDFEQFGYRAGVSVHLPDRDAGAMLDIDRIIDDGNLLTGSFRQRANGYIWIIEE